VKAVAAALLALATTAASWVDPYATAREGSALYAAGKFADAAAKYREALTDDPDSTLLHYNAAAAAYRDGKYDAALAALGQIPPSDTEPARTARVAYNAGNAKYRLGATAEASNPQQALGLYAEALAAYRRAMGADPADEDAKFNHELVEKKIADLRKKLEEQQKKNQDQQQQQQQQNEQQQQNDQQQPQQNQEQQQQQGEQQPQHDGEQKADRQEPPPEQPQEQPKPGGDGEQQRQQADANEPPEHQDAPGEQAPQGDRQRGQGGDAVGGQKSDDEMSPHEAEALLDGQRDQEVRPDEIVRQLQGARVAEPGEDW
jgi:Ca-activated chloride channel family protein